ncbi:Hypothetical predicted protein [Marmota monax]|uniref:Uncharacterized protein n=1 Tax=Marmota monax TaxID=9995 RepID=A0A5E4AQA7_MARMO|nr:Hypothetical predicted protein [Marmota monax]
MAAPALKALLGWSGLAPGLLRTVSPLLGQTQVRWSRYGAEFRDPLIDKEHYRKSVAELTEEEKYDQELKKTQLIKAAPATKTSSVFADPVIRLDGNTCSTDWDYPREGLQQGYHNTALES